MLEELINFCFNDGDKEFIGITRYGAIYTNNQQKYRLSFNQTSLKSAINYLLDNRYLALGSMCFSQLIGIPMRYDPAAFMANLFPCHYENCHYYENCLYY